MASIIGLSGSLRRASFNAMLLRAASQLMVSNAERVFDSEGQMIDGTTRTRLEAFMNGFAAFVSDRRR
jgi:hypothetical protein